MMITWTCLSRQFKVQSLSEGFSVICLKGTSHLFNKNSLFNRKESILKCSTAQFPITEEQQQQCCCLSGCVSMHVVTSTFIGVSQNGDPALTHKQSLPTEIGQLERTKTKKSINGSTLTSCLFWDRSWGGTPWAHQCSKNRREYQVLELEGVRRQIRHADETHIACIELNVKNDEEVITIWKHPEHTEQTTDNKVYWASHLIRISQQEAVTLLQLLVCPPFWLHFPPLLHKLTHKHFVLIAWNTV